MLQTYIKQSVQPCAACTLSASYHVSLLSPTPVEHLYAPIPTLVCGLQQLRAVMEHVTSPPYYQL